MIIPKEKVLLQLKDVSILDIDVNTQTIQVGYCDTCYDEYEVTKLYITYKQDDKTQTIDIDLLDSISITRLIFLLTENKEQIEKWTLLEFEEFCRTMLYDENIEGYLEV